MVTSHEILSFSGPDELARAAASAWLDEVAAASRDGRTYCVALSGGRITQKFFGQIVALAKVRTVSLDCVHFFWADERCVPATDPESNFKLAHDLLFEPLGIVTEKLHRLRGELPPQEAVQIAEREFLGVASDNGQRSAVFDLILLGMGEDGHVASLFPGRVSETIGISAPFVVVEGSPKPPPTRISLSYQAIFAAKSIWVLASGGGKAEALKASLVPNSETPLGIVIGRRTVKIFCDINEF